jgi:competence protein ComEC
VTDILSQKQIKILITNFIILITLVISAVSGWWQIQNNQNQGDLQVSFLDVGQGDSIFIETPNKIQIIIDTGPNGKILQELNKKMSFFDNDIDLVVLTHPDADHIGGTVDLYNSYEIGKIIYATSSKQNDLIKEVFSLPVEKKEVKEGDVIMLDAERNIYLEILHPESDYVSPDSNDQSIVAKLVYGKTCFMFMGDASKEVEMKIIKKYQNEIQCDVLKVGHHGSHTSSEETFIGFVSPKYSIISAGKNNRYGHPHKEVLEILKKVNSKILNTADLGAINFWSDGEKISLDNVSVF